MINFDKKIWIPYNELSSTLNNLKRKQINDLYYTDIKLDNYDEFGKLSFCFVPLEQIYIYEKRCEKLYEAIQVRDTETVICDEIYYTTKIEGAHTTRKRTHEIHNGDKLDNNNYTSEKMVQNGFRATKYLNVIGNKVNKDNIRKIWEILVEDVCDNADIKGFHYRNGDVEIGNVYGLAPDQLEDAMNNWFSYYNSATDNELPFIKAALLHYSFERIHPFCDGNGRMGRLLSSNFLIGLGYDKIKAVSFSMSIGKHSDGYYNTMNLAGNNYFDCTPFLVYMLEREVNALGYAYLQNKLGEYLSLVNDETLNNLKSIDECNNIYNDLLPYINKDNDEIDREDE